MTKNVAYGNMEPFQNPDNLPLEALQLTVRTDGIELKIDALNKHWARDYTFLHYESPQLYDKDGNEIFGAKEHWMELVDNMIEDVKWLLCLPYYRFWSNVIFNKSILNALVSFLQDAPPFYALENFPNYPDMLELLESLSHYVLVVFTRLITNKESRTEYMSNLYFGNLLYENYVFTVPIIFDLCQLYGRSNKKVVKHILEALFTLEPRYNNDVQRAVPCLIEALENVESKFDNGSTRYTDEAVSLSNHASNTKKLTLFNLEDMILYILDISSTIHVFLNDYHPAVNIFHREEFINKLVKIYEGTIPEMYKALCQLACNDEYMPKYMELNHRLNVTRVEILSLFRIIIHEPIINIQQNSTIKETEIKEEVDKYLNLLLNAISEKEFITDYDHFYPIQIDLATIMNICSEVDTIKCKYILQSLNTIENRKDDQPTVISNNINEPGPSGVSKQTIASKATKPVINKENEKLIEMACLVSAVKDILPDLDENFIGQCLQYYKNSTEDVIHAVLEDTLPPALKILRDSRNVLQEISVIEDVNHGFERMIVNDNYDYENDLYVKTEKIIEVPKDYITRNYSLIPDVYDDDYDDTYDDRDTHTSAQDDSVEADSRPFTTPRIFWKKQRIEAADDSESEDEEVKGAENGKDHFVQNPEEVRAKAEQRRQAMRGNERNVIGEPRGQGQDQSVLHNRQQKNVHKSTRANHNRRSGAQRKRNQGMVPS